MHAQTWIMYAWTPSPPKKKKNLVTPLPDRVYRYVTLNRWLLTILLSTLKISLRWFGLKHLACVQYKRLIYMQVLVQCTAIHGWQANEETWFLEAMGILRVHALNVCTQFTWNDVDALGCGDTPFFLSFSFYSQQPKQLALVDSSCVCKSGAAVQHELLRKSLWVRCPPGRLGQLRTFDCRVLKSRAAVLLLDGE